MICIALIFEMLEYFSAVQQQSQRRAPGDCSAEFCWFLSGQGWRLRSSPARFVPMFLKRGRNEQRRFQFPSGAEEDE